MVKTMNTKQQTNNQTQNIPLITLWSVNKTYRDSSGEHPVLQQFNAKIFRGELILISGSGKNTLGKLIAGIEKPNSGLVQVDGLFINELSEWELNFWRKANISFISQFSTMNKENNLTTPLNTNPKIVILDEPFQGIKDPDQVTPVIDSLLDRGKTVIVLSDFPKAIKHPGRILR